MSVVLAVAPHPDDETLGYGGTLLRHRAEGDQIHWLIVTAVSPEFGWSAQRMAERATAIDNMAADYSFASVTQLGLPTARLDTLPLSDLVATVAQVIETIRPDTVYTPHSGDVHSDHRLVFQAVAAATKTFRSPYVRRLLVCEIQSETDFAVQPDRLPFQPNVFVDITPYLSRKIALLSHFASEMGVFPFPRSAEAIRALAMCRGAQAGVAAAEAFMLLKEIR
ncbi:PIG-L deacetylase family protein [Magnetospirillum sulfuroxidans]|uniref:PIG-L family deacetylase n=1 Tax=Magnetospirillum sulfuroxidans TaxID=611300 RepID=A0ABS5IH28_9PROT|nr:PIG-L family deacetylase [Magnetospirillum sulfuroxidans]